MTTYKDLMAFVRETEALGQVAGRLGWDQETMMPRGAAEQRGEESAALEAVLHARRTDPFVGEALAAIDPGALDQIGQAQLRAIRRDYDRATKVPAKLATSLARLTSVAQGKWAEARAESNFASFAPVLAEVIALKREEGAALAQGGDVYDALLQDFEPGQSAEKIAAIFDEMRPALTELRQAVMDAPAPAPLDHHFEPETQMALAHQIAERFGYDTARGRLDKAVHPFSSGSGNDVRITTRTSETDPFNCLYSTIHETGHACYEQNIDQAYLLTPLGRGVSMGVHESQSRLYENQLGRSRAFTGWLYGQMRDAFGAFGIDDAEAFYACVNRVEKGYIRTEADELQYNLHIMLRFDLERALMRGALEVADLEAAWNDRFAADFGYPVDSAANGVLQDVHWSVGLFGYFPTYSLGNVYAGCLFEAMQRALPDLETDLAAGDLTRATGWLREALQQHGGLRDPVETITHATDTAPTAAPLLDYLKTKFSTLYRLG